jgi:DinB superfamily
MEIALDRLGTLIDQFDTSWSIGGERLAGLEDREYRWEPWPAMWSVRPRGKAASLHPIGSGEWQLDNSMPDDNPDPSPLTTIAWRLGHLTSGLAGRWEYTFGERKADPETLVDFSADAAHALAQLSDWMQLWREGLLSLTDEQLETPGFGQYPWGLDPHIPFLGIIWWENREIIHHLAEVALLRDLYRVIG